MTAATMYMSHGKPQTRLDPESRRQTRLDGGETQEMRKLPSQTREQPRRKRQSFLDALLKALAAFGA
jgi:hypothetical protein